MRSPSPPRSPPSAHRRPVAFVGAAVAADLLHLRLKKPVRAYLTQHNSFISQATLDGYGFVSAVTNRLRDIVGVHE